MTFISYASNFEDVLLNRVFGNKSDGFYIDIGADHPVFSSTTKAFYDRGWHGVNVEPGPAFALIEAHRRRDLNVRAAITDFDGEIDFYVHDDLQATSSIYSEVHPAVAMRSTRRTHCRVPAMTLATLTKRYADGRNVDFLKIDAEGAEESIIRGADWTTFRPRIIVAESTEPFSTVRVDAEWAALLERSGYREAYFDGINTWFIRDENPEDLENFRVPVNVLDDFVKYDPRLQKFGKNGEVVASSGTRRKSVLRRLRRSIAKRVRRLTGLFGRAFHFFRHLGPFGTKNQSRPVAKFSTATGDWWLPTDNELDIVIAAMKSGSFFEQDIVEAAKAFIKPGSVVLDVGSNFGQMAVAFSRMVGPSGTVHAFEADAFIFDLLQRNLKENDCNNVEAHFGAVWRDDGLTLFYPEPDFKRFGSYGSYGIDMKARKGRQVQSFTIDSLDIKGPISFIKVDIQGSDLFAMMGARRTIARDKPAIIFEYEEQFQSEFGTSFEDYMNFVEEIGYEIAGEVGSIPYVRNFIILPRTN